VKRVRHTTHVNVNNDRFDKAEIIE